MPFSDEHRAAIAAYEIKRRRRRGRTALVRALVPLVLAALILLPTGPLRYVAATATWAACAWNVQALRLEWLRRRAWDIVYAGPPGLEQIVHAFALLQGETDDPVLDWAAAYAYHTDRTARLEQQRMQAETS